MTNTRGERVRFVDFASVASVVLNSINTHFKVDKVYLNGQV